MSPQCSCGDGGRTRAPLVVSPGQPLEVWVNGITLASGLPSRDLLENIGRTVVELLQEAPRIPSPNGEQDAVPAREVLLRVWCS